MTILEKIIETKKKELDIVKKTISIEELKKLSDFERKSISLVDRLKNSSHGIIAEHKRKSPSKSIINNSISINEIIIGYHNANVCGISVLTDKEYFGGSLNDLRNARKLTNIPILRKEFIIDEYQIIEAKANGADVILLIAACLEKDKIKSHIVILGNDPASEQVKYLHGNFGNGTFTYYGGHDPEDYQHFVGDPTTDLSLHRNSPGYRLILNNILFPAARKKEKKT